MCEAVLQCKLWWPQLVYNWYIEIIIKIKYYVRDALYEKHVHVYTENWSLTSSKTILSHSHDWRHARSSPQIFRATSAEQRQISDVTEQLIYHQWFISEGSDQHRRRGIKLCGRWWTTVAWGSWLRLIRRSGLTVGEYEKKISVSQTWKNFCLLNFFIGPLCSGAVTVWTPSWKIPLTVNDEIKMQKDTLYFL